MMHRCEFCNVLLSSASKCRISQEFAEGKTASYLLSADEGTRMVDNKELESGLKAIAEDFCLPGGGRKKLSQLVAGHMPWFDAAERRGMGWRDMVRALAAAGVSGGGGKPLSVGTLSSTVWRKRAEIEDVMNRAGRRARSEPTEPIPEGQPVRARKASPTEQGTRTNVAARKSAARPAPAPPPKLPESGKSDRKPSASLSIQDKLSRVAKLRGS